MKNSWLFEIKSLEVSKESLNVRKNTNFIRSLPRKLRECTRFSIQGNNLLLVTNLHYFILRFLK